MEIKRICITGAGSMIGAALAEYALSRGVEVLALTRPGGRNAPRHPLCTAVECDLASLDALRDLPHCDALAHLAWCGTYGADRDNALLQTENIRRTLDAAALAAKLGCGCFLFAGSQAEYGVHNAPLRPDTPAFPASGYGVAKLAAGRLSRIQCRSNGIRHVHARILSVYGAADRPETFVSACVDSMRRGTAPELTACTQMWDYLYVRDAARALFLLCESGRDGMIYPVGSGVCRSLRDYAEDIREMTGCAAQPQYGARPLPQGGVTYLLADISALTADTGFVPAYSFRDGIAEILRERNNSSI